MSFDEVVVMPVDGPPFVAEAMALALGATLVLTFRIGVQTPSTQ